MTSPNTIDEAYIRDTVRNHIERFNIPLTDLGRALGRETNKSSLLNYHGERFLYNDRKSLTLEQVARAADFLGVPVMQLIRPLSQSGNAINSTGNYNQNVVQTGGANTVNGTAPIESGKAETGDLAAFIKLPREDRDQIIEFLKHTNQ